jgi:glutamine cyclotransferase
MASGTKIVPTVLLPVLLAGLSLAGCVKHVPKVAIPEKDASPPKLVWEVYNLQTKETKGIEQDGQSFVVAPGDLYVVTLAVEDLESGVKEVSLTGNADYKCEQGGKVEEKKYQLEPQTQKASPDYDKKVPVKAELTLSIDESKHGCMEHQRFDGGTISLTGKAQNSLNGGGTKTLRVNLQPRPSS